MVLKRGLECGGFIGYDAPIIPRARRSVRKRSFFCKKKKTFDEGQLCAFELLAAVAGKLLQESESSSASSNAAVPLDDHNASKAVRTTEQEEQGSSEESVVSSAISLQKTTHLQPNKTTFDTISSLSKVAVSDVKPAIHRSGRDFHRPPRKIDGSSPKCSNVDTGMATGRELKTVTDDMVDSKVAVESCGKLAPPMRSGEKAGLGYYKGSATDPSYAKHRNDVKKEGTDEDEILSQCSNPVTRQKAYGSQTSADNCETRKLITSKYWKSAPKLKDSRPADSDSIRNNIKHNGKPNCEHESVQHNTPFKKRKLFGQTSVVTHEKGVSSESVSNLTAKGVHNWSGSVIKRHEGNKISSSSMDCQRSSSSSNVKLSVKSFKVPELLIEVPESTTIGSLKKNVLDAITTVLGGGLRVGVLLHGKKIRDDNKSLLQTGISEDDNLNDLNFILEPSSPGQLSLNPPHEDCPVLPTYHSPKDYVNRSLNPKEELSLLDKPDRSSATGSDRICQDLVPFSAPKPENKPASDSRALVPVPENMEALAVMPINSRQQRTELGQRRTRRPFSVSEVEALVQAVEKMGTGRWRDVKLCAFENAKHRTYVDLKDKWKTLVHTARISPQQRRGEPVPQQLLDRVLAAHAYWSQLQAKQHGRQQLQSHQAGLLKISDSPAEKLTA